LGSWLSFKNWDLISIFIIVSQVCKIWWVWVKLRDCVWVRVRLGVRIRIMMRYRVRVRDRVRDRVRVRVRVRD
jgi:hypothetical protein